MVLLCLNNVVTNKTKAIILNSPNNIKSKQGGNSMIKEIIHNSEEKMNKTIQILKKELASMKAGRANPTMLDKVEVDYYGSMVPINQVANISAPEPRIIVIQPWEKSMLKNIEKAILKSDLGLNPSNDGSIIRLIIPELTEETRRALVKTVKKSGEESKVAIRSIRREANDKIKVLKKNNEISEDEMKKAEEDIQKKTDNYIKEIDKIIELKEKEIMSI
ncbi:ribosome recycling factor [Clostridium sp. USBA 49]|nr:ribosome recycling factor [Clostridium sp. USBA 49]